MTTETVDEFETGGRLLAAVLHSSEIDCNLLLIRSGPPASERVTISTKRWGPECHPTSALCFLRFVGSDEFENRT
jgi:hypothetical protein